MELEAGEGRNSGSLKPPPVQAAIGRFYGTIPPNLSYIDASAGKTFKRGASERYRVEK
jgi:hypothetical protein